MRGNTGYVPKRARRAIDRKVDVLNFLTSPAGQHVGQSDIGWMAERYGVTTAAVSDCLAKFGRLL